MDKYEFEEGMGQISGFGGDYESACRKMLKAGLNWLDQNPQADLKFHGYKEVYGVLDGDNQDAKALSNIVISVVPDCTGAMHQAVITSILWIRKNGWDAYVKEMKKKIL